MSAPLEGARSLLRDAESARQSAARQAAADWSDAAQREFYTRILTQLDREAAGYGQAIDQLDSSLAQALRLLQD